MPFVCALRDKKNLYNILNMYAGIVATDDMWQIRGGSVNSD